VAPLTQIERAESELYRVAEEGRQRERGEELRRGDRMALEQAERRSIAAAICPASPLASTG
jgi:hypothetical protein